VSGVRRNAAYRRPAPIKVFLIATIVGLPTPDGKRLHMLGKKMQWQVIEAAHKIDLFLWIDATAGTGLHLPPTARSIAPPRLNFWVCLNRSRES
jgi:hypothetical protein